MLTFFKLGDDLHPALAISKIARDELLTFQMPKFSTLTLRIAGATDRDVLAYATAFEAPNGDMKAFPRPIGPVVIPRSFAFQIVPEAEDRAAGAPPSTAGVSTGAVPYGLTALYIQPQSWQGATYPGSPVAPRSFDWSRYAAVQARIAEVDRLINFFRGNALMWAQLRALESEKATLQNQLQALWDARPYMGETRTAPTVEANSPICIEVENESNNLKNKRTVWQRAMQMGQSPAIVNALRNLYMQGCREALSASATPSRGGINTSRRG